MAFMADTSAISKRTSLNRELISERGVLEIVQKESVLTRELFPIRRD